MSEIRRSYRAHDDANVRIFLLRLISRQLLTAEEQVPASRSAVGAAFYEGATILS